MEFFSNLLASLPGAVAQGLIWGLMAIGVYITFKVLDLADLTVDGTMATGGAVCLVLMTHGVNLWSRCCARPRRYARGSRHRRPAYLYGYSGHSRRYPDAARAVLRQPAHHGQQGERRDQSG